MERHLSTGTAMIVALMAAHRVARNGDRQDFAERAVTRVEATRCRPLSRAAPDETHGSNASNSHLLACPGLI